MIPLCLRALSPHAYARELLRRALASGDVRAITAAQARVNYHAGMVPQRFPGTPREAWVAWHRQAGIAGFGNRSARAYDLDLRSVPGALTVEDTRT